MKPKICEMPYQPGDEKPVRADDPNGPQWGELFGRPRVVPVRCTVVMADGTRCSRFGKSQYAGRCTQHRLAKERST